MSLDAVVPGVRGRAMGRPDLCTFVPDAFGNVGLEGPAADSVGSGLLGTIPDCFPGLLREFLYRIDPMVLRQPEGMASGPQSLAGQQEASGGLIRERIF